MLVRFVPVVKPHFQKYIQTTCQLCNAMIHRIKQHAKSVLNYLLNNRLVSVWVRAMVRVYTWIMYKIKQFYTYVKKYLSNGGGFRYEQS